MKKTPIFRYTIVAVAALGLGLAINPTPEPEIVQVAGPVQTKTVTKTVNEPVPFTPPECITALDLAGEGIGILAETSSLSGEAVGAAAARDGATLDRITGELKVLNADLEAIQPELRASVTVCRASAE